MYQEKTKIARLLVLNTAPKSTLDKYIIALGIAHVLSGKIDLA